MQPPKKNSSTPHTADTAAAGSNRQSSPFQSGGRKKWLTRIFLAACLLFTAGVALYDKREADAATAQEFEFACTEITNRIVSRLQQHAQILRSASSLFEVTGALSREQWRTSIAHQNIDQHLPGIQGIGYAKIILPAELSRHEAAVRKEGFPNYAVKPAGKRDLYTSIIYLEPFSGRNLRAFGYDMFSEPIRREAMMYARDHDEAALSGKITLVQETGTDVQAGTLMYVPVYEKDAPILTLEERRRAIRGWTYSPYRMNDLMRGILGGWEFDEGKTIRLEVFDGMTSRADALLYDSHPKTEAGASSSAASVERSSVAINNRHWNLRFTPIGGMNSRTDYSKPWIVLIGGTMLSGLLFVFVRSLINTRYTAQKMADALTSELCESEEKYRIIFNNEIYAICIFDLEHMKLLDINDAYCRVYGYTRDELLSGMTIHDITAERQSSEAATVQAVHEGTIFIPLRYHKKKDGTIFPVEIVGGPYTWKGRKVMFALAHDITERKEAEEALQAAKLRYDNLVKNIHIGIYILRTTPAGGFRFEYISPRLAEMYGADAEHIIAEPRLAFDIIHPDDLAGFEALNRERIGEGRPFRWEGRATIAGIPRWLRIASTPQSQENGDMLWHGIVVDISERKNMEAALHHTQKIESIGVLAGGIAHDFNNLLAGMMGNVSLAEENLPPGHTSKKFLEKALAAMDRAAVLTKQLLAYSGKGKYQIQLIDIGAMVRDHADLIAASLPKTVRFVTTLPPDPVRVKGDPGQIEQVLMNLIINAGEAIGDTSGVVALSLSTVSLGKADASAFGVLTHVSLHEGAYALLEVRDDGPGMHPATLEKIFDPFFTTKFTGRGLGLSAVLGIIQGHQGGITVESREGEGTTFRILLPAEAEPPPEKVQVNDGAQPQTTELRTILVIDDEEDVAGMAMEILKTGEYTALVELNPVKGIELYRRHRAEIAAVLLDLTMPEMSGRDVVEALEGIDPGVRIIITSGYSETEMAQKMGSKKVSAFLQKPYRRQELLSVVRSVLQ